MFDWLGNLLGGNKNQTTAQPAPKPNILPEGMSYVGPYSKEAYNAAGMINDGGAGAPYSQPIINSGRAILDAQPPKPPPPAAPDPNAAANAAAAAAKAKADADSRRELGVQESQLGGAGVARDTAKSSILSRLSQILGGYDSETTRNTTDYNAGIDTNRGNYNRDQQVALLNAARGRQGLFGTLSSLGALSGSGIDLADRAVQQGANLEIADANENFRTTETGLRTAYDEYDRQDKLRRQEAETQKNSLMGTADNNYFKTQQDIFLKMSNLYNALGDTVQADNYARQASGLSNQIGQTGVIGAQSPMAASYTPAALGQFLSPGVNDVSVSQANNAGNGLIPSLMASIRRREQGA